MNAWPVGLDAFSSTYSPSAMTTTFQPTAISAIAAVPDSTLPIAPSTGFACGIYFNGVYLVFVMNNEITGDRFGQIFHKALVSTFTYPLWALADGQYGLSTGGIASAAATYLDGYDAEPNPGLGSYGTLSCVRLVDRVFAFVPDSTWQTVRVVCVSAKAEGGISAGLWTTLQLPNAAPGFVPVAQDGMIQLLYPDPTQPQIDSLIFNPEDNTVTPGPSIQVGGQIQAPYTNLSVSDVPLGSGGLNLAFTDANNNLYFGQVVQGAITNPQMFYAPINMPAGTTADLKVAAGPMIGQLDQASVVFFTSIIGSNSPVNYTQAPLIQPTNCGPVAVLEPTGGYQSNVAGTFASEAYLPLPGSTSGLFRVLVYGVVFDSDTGMFLLNIIPTGQLFYQNPVVTDTSQTDKLTSAQKQVYEQSWTLLGIIQGPPPWVSNGPGVTTPTTAQIDFSTTSGATSTITYGVSVSAGGSGSGDIFSFSGSASYALTQSEAKTTSFTKKQTISLADSTDNIGLVIVRQPTISNTEYQVYSPDGSTYLHFSLYVIRVTDVVTTMLPFDITDPSAHTYSTGLTPLPASSDLASWQNLNLPSLPQPALLPPALTATQAASSTSSFSSTTSQDISTKNKVSVSATFGVFGFSSTVGFSWSNTVETSTSFTNGYSSSISAIAVNNPVQSTDVTYVEIQPYILQTTGATSSALSGLVPNLYAGSTPWILTWRVLSYSTQGTA